MIPTSYGFTPCNYEKKCKRTYVVLDCFKTIILGTKTEEGVNEMNADLHYECDHIKNKSVEFKQKCQEQYFKYESSHDIMDCAYMNICCNECIVKLEKERHIIIYHKKYYHYLNTQYKELLNKFTCKYLADNDITYAEYDKYLNSRDFTENDCIYSNNEEHLDTIREKISVGFRMATSSLFREILNLEIHINKLLTKYNLWLDKLYGCEPYKYLI